jgi:hypothetical protein
MSDDDYEKRAQEYYDRKQRHREEMLPYLGWLFVISVLAFTGWTIYQAVVRWLTS